MIRFVYLLSFYKSKAMPYEIRYATKKKGSGISTVPTNEMAKAELLKLFKQKLPARIEKDNIIIGECYKADGKWAWYIDTEA